jgi:hypothetical protein
MASFLDNLYFIEFGCSGMLKSAVQVNISPENLSPFSAFDANKIQKAVFALIFFHLLALKPKLERKTIYSNNFFRNFHLSESTFTCRSFRQVG